MDIDKIDASGFKPVAERWHALTDDEKTLVRDKEPFKSYLKSAAKQEKILQDARRTIAASAGHIPALTLDTPLKASGDLTIAFEKQRTASQYFALSSQSARSLIERIQVFEQTPIKQLTEMLRSPIAEYAEHMRANDPKSMFHMTQGVNEVQSDGLTATDFYSHFKREFDFVRHQNELWVSEGALGTLLSSRGVLAKKLSESVAHASELLGWSEMSSLATGGDDSLHVNATKVYATELQVDRAFDKYLHQLRIDELAMRLFKSCDENDDMQVEAVLADSDFCPGVVIQAISLSKYSNEERCAKVASESETILNLRQQLDFAIAQYRAASDARVIAEEKATRGVRKASAALKKLSVEDDQRLVARFASMKKTNKHLSESAITKRLSKEFEVSESTVRRTVKKSVSSSE